MSRVGEHRVNFSAKSFGGYTPSLESQRDMEAITPIGALAGEGASSAAIGGYTGTPIHLTARRAEADVDSSSTSGANAVSRLYGRRAAEGPEVSRCERSPFIAKTSSRNDLSGQQQAEGALSHASTGVVLMANTGFTLDLKGCSSNLPLTTAGNRSKPKARRDDPGPRNSRCSCEDHPAGLWSTADGNAVWTSDAVGRSRSVSANGTGLPFASEPCSFVKEGRVAMRAAVQPSTTGMNPGGRRPTVPSTLVESDRSRRVSAGARVLYTVLGERERECSVSGMEVVSQ